MKTTSAQDIALGDGLSSELLTELLSMLLSLLMTPDVFEAAKESVHLCNV